MPDGPRNAVQNVQLVAPVIHSNAHDGMYLTCVAQMLVGNRIVIPIMGPHEFLKKSRLRDSHSGLHPEFRLICHAKHHSERNIFAHEIQTDPQPGTRRV